MRKTIKKGEQGSALTEFLLTFPAFLVLCMLTLEASSMWMDRHIVRLASFEAARRIAASDEPLEGNPCTVDDNLKAGRAVAVRRLASISPSVTYLMSVLGLKSNAANSLPNLGNSKFARSMKRLLLRLPSAAALTKLECDYQDDTVTVKLTYQRMPTMPVVDKIIYAAYQIALFNGTSTNKNISLDASFRQVGTVTAAQATKLKSKVTKALSTAQAAGLNDDDTARMVEGVDGLQISNVSGFSQTSETMLSGVFRALPAKVKETSKTKMNSQEAILSAALFATGQRVIPMNVSTSIQRKTVATRVAGPDTTDEESWDGVMKGVMRLNPGDWRNWAKSMSKSGDFLKGGKDL